MLDLAKAVRLALGTWARTAGRLLVIAALWPAVMAAHAQPAGGGPTDVVLVLDASGSMFNRLEDGRYRIAAAKEALSALVSRLPEDGDLRVGLRVYGSQMLALVDGSCEDSLLTVPVAPVDRARLLASVQETEALGATPIAYSLELAAQDLSSATGRKLIVLVTDGEESCGGDVRAVAERLASEGFEIDLRIIGFALSEAAARSFEGIGTFESANSAAELAAALGRAVELTPAAETERVTVALTRDGQPANDGAAVTFVGALDAEPHAFRATGAGVFAADLPAGGYAALVADAFDPAGQTFAGLSVTAGGPNEFAFELAPAFAVELTVAPDEPVAGGEVQVSFTGAAPAARAWLTVVPVAAPDDAYVGYEGVSGASGAADVLVPFDEGQLEARYHLVLPEGGSRVVGRSAPFTAAHVAVELDAPEEVSGGTTFEVVWEGPGNDADYLTVVPAGAEPAALLSYAYTLWGNPSSLTAPVDPGSYEVRYVSGSGGGVLASRPLQVVASEVRVDAPAQAAAGSTVSVAWQGPDGQGDWLVFAPQGSPPETYLSYAYTAWGPALDLVVPLAPGEYEVRYLSGAEGAVLASVPVTVTETVVVIQAPAEVDAGATFTVTWQGPNSANDYLTVVPVGAPEGTQGSVAFTLWGPALELTAPDAPGSYEVRYVNGLYRASLGSVPVTVR